MNVDVYDHSTKIGSIVLPNGKMSTQYVKANWSSIISGPLLKIMSTACDPNDIGLKSQADFIKWLQDYKNWKRGYKGKVDAPNCVDYWGVALTNQHIHRMYWTDEFEDGLDLNFFSSPKDASLLSIHLHSD